MAESAFVGRAAELRTLRSVFARARGGSGGTMVITGEPGIGKTRLAREFVREVAAAGATVAWGRCYQGPWAPPLTPWGEAVNELLGHNPAEKQDASILANILPARSSVAVAPHAIHLTGEDERLRVFDAATRVLLNAAMGRPHVVVLDDAQWADPMSVDLLRHVAFYVPRRAIVLLVLDRTGEPERPAHLSDGLSWLRNEGGGELIALGGLTSDDVAAMIGADSLRVRNLAATLTQQTSGNPFFIEELLSQAREDGGFDLAAGEFLTSVPESIRAVIERRVHRLSSTAQSLLQLASIFANGFDVPAMQGMIDASEAELLDALDELLAARILESMPGYLERYDFVHAIVRQCLYAALNPSRRVRLHRRAATVIESVYEARIAQAAAEIAVQYHRSLTLPGAINGLSHALRVVEECHEQCTPEYAVTFLRIARDLSREGPLEQQASVVGQLSSAEAEIVQVDAALETMDEYLALAPRAGLSPAQIAERLGIVAHSLKYSAYAEERCWRPIVERALKLVGPEEGRIWARLKLMIDPVEPLSRSGIRVGRWLGFDPKVVKVLRSSGDDDDAARSMESFDAVTRAETDAYLTRIRGSSSPTAVMYGLTVAANHFQYRHGAFRDAARLWQELIELSERASAIHWQQQATNQLTYLLIAEGDFEAAAKTEEASNDLAARLGPGQHPAAHQLEMATCRAMYQGGDWPGIARQWRDMLDDPALGPHDLATLTGAHYGGLAAYCAAQADDMDGARRILALLTPIIRQMRPNDCNHNGAVAFAAGAIWRLEATDLAPIYRALAQELIDANSGDYPQTSLHLSVGQMSALLERKHEAMAYYAETRAAVTANGPPPLLPIINMTEAESLLRWGDPESYRRILELTEAARKRFTEFRMMPWLQDLQVLVDAAEEKFLRKQHLPGNITEREADVLRLIAKGLSDRQVSDALFVSPRTINAHVRNMLAKTDAVNRVELAMWARSNGIVEA